MKIQFEILFKFINFPAYREKLLLNNNFWVQIKHKLCFSLSNLLKLDIGLKLKIVPESWEYTEFWKFGPYWPQK